MRFLALLLATLSFSAVAQVYKWTDENGVTHFGTQPPPGQSKSVDVKPASGHGDPAKTSSDGAESLIIKQVRQLEQRQMEEEAARAKKRNAELTREIDQRYQQSRQSNAEESRSCRRVKIILKGAEDELDLLLRRGYKQSERRDAEDRVRRWKTEKEYYCN